MLTRREEQVLDLLIQGLINRDIGRDLGISARTVEVHRTNLMRKLGLKSRTELDQFIKQQKQKKSDGEPTAQPTADPEGGAPVDG